MQTLEGQLDGSGRRFCLVVSRFNHFITDRLLEGAKETLLRHGVAEDDLTLIRVPGTFEAPPAALRAANSGLFDAVVCLGAVIRGGTPHFDYVAAEAAKGTAEVAMRSGLPVAFGILTTDNLEQAIERAGNDSGNKGGEAALAALEMADLYGRLAQAGL